jgi:hypothetical protein
MLMIFTTLISLILIGVGIFSIVYKPKQLDTDGKIKKWLYENKNQQMVGGGLIGLGVLMLVLLGYQQANKQTMVIVSSAEIPAITKSSFGFKFY